MKNLPRSVINIGGRVSNIEIQFEESDNEVQIWNFMVDNSFKVNPLIAIFATCTIFLIIFLIVLRKENAKNPGLAFCMCAIVLGVCMMLMEPSYIVGWDEQIHYRKAYSMGISDKKTAMSQAGDYIVGEAHNLNTYGAPSQESMEERVDIIRMFNGMERNDGVIPLDSDIQISSAGYIFQALFMKIGMILHMPFYVMWLLGKLANVLVYAVVVGFAVHIIPIGKRLLIVIGLMPVMLFQATTYTYDVTVIAFLILGSSILVKEVIYCESKFTYRWRVLMIACFIFGCLPKAVYAPLILGGLLLGKDKFYSDKDRKIFKGALLVIFVGLIASFVLPTMLAPDQVTDTRGGATDGGRQIRYVLGQPFAYATILIRKVLETLPGYIMGEDVLTPFAYYGTGRQSVFYSALLIGATLTDSYSEGKKRVLGKKERIGFMVLICLVVVLIWTALYLSYTPVGDSSIAGVQARYYLPFLLLFYLCFQSEKIKNHFSVERYQMCIMMSSSLLLMLQMFQLIVMNKCL